VSLTSSPFSYFAPQANFVYELGALSFLKLISAAIIIFQIKQVALRYPIETATHDCRLNLDRYG